MKAGERIIKSVRRARDWDVICEAVAAAAQIPVDLIKVIRPPPVDKERGA